jgi:hypothetical protein
VVLPRGAVVAAHRIATSTGGRSVVLDAERDVARVVWPGQDASLDIAAWTAASLEADLRQRDFSVNAMACPLHERPDPATVLDPVGGLDDLAARRLRMASASSFARDPLRLLRGVRLAVELDFQLEPETEEAMRRHAHLAPHSAAERVTDELFRVVAHSSAARGVSLLDDLGLSRAIGLTPTDRRAWKGLTALRACLEDLGSATVTVVATPAWRALEAVSVPVREHLDRRIAAARTVGSLLGLAALGDDLEPPDARIRLADRFKLSRAERRRLQAIEAARAVWPEVVASGGGRLSVYRLFRAAGAAGVEAVMLELALDVEGTGGGSTVASAAEGALQTWFLERSLVQPRTLVDGTELLDALGIEPGPIAGAVLEAVREAQVEGRVLDRESALAEAAAASARLSKAP